MTTQEADLPAPEPAPTRERPVRKAVLAVAGVGLVALIVASANAVLLTASHLGDVRLPMLGLGLVMSTPGWLLLILAARVRGAPRRWLAIAAGWGFFVAPLLSFIGEDQLQPLVTQIGLALKPLGGRIADVGPGTIVAPLVEEPAKGIGVLVVLLGIRRARAPLTPGLGAAVGALCGMAFSLTEITHRLAEAVASTGYEDLNGVFVINWDSVWRAEQLQLVNRLFIFGLSDHALFTALAGVGIVQLLRGRLRAAIAWFVAALACHALFNAIGTTVGGWAFDTALTALGGIEAGLAALLAAGWIAAVAGFLVSQAWAAYLLRRGTRQAVV